MPRSTARIAVLTTVAAAALALAACDHEVRIARKDRPDGAAPFKTIARLDCPEKQGDLRRVSAASDGQTCAYAFEDKTEVTLQLTPAAAGEDAALAPIETQLRALLPPPAASGKSEEAAEIKADDEKAHIRLPGVSIDAEGDRAQIHVGGLHIEGEGDRANITMTGRRGEGMSIVANDGGAEIRQNRGGARGVSRSLILATEHPAADGYRLVGYEARGPKAGPLVVAVVRARGEAETDYVFKDMKALVRRNTAG
jgi:hypothetical protein